MKMEFVLGAFSPTVKQVGVQRNGHRSRHPAVDWEESAS